MTRIPESVSGRPQRRSPHSSHQVALSLLLTTCLPLTFLFTAQPAQADRANSTIVDSTRGGGKVVALTFDDGPHPVYTPQLLEVLRKYNVKATFCLWGDHVQEHPELVREIVDAGHVLCNHSMHHADMGTWSRARTRADIKQTNAAIHRAAPRAQIRYFRAPFGSWGKSPEVAARLGLQPLGWRLSVGDWNLPGVDVLVHRLEQGVTPGAVVLLHDGGGDRSQTVEAVARIIPKLRAEGWRFGLPAPRGRPSRPTASLLQD